MRQSEPFSALGAVFGGPSSSAWGSAVFVDRVDLRADLEKQALAAYCAFIGALWERFGEQAWMSAWRLVQTREGAGDIRAELTMSESPSVKSAAEILLASDSTTPEAIQAALSAAFDGSDTDVVQVYEIGDGAAYSGILVAGRMKSGATAILAFVMD